MKRIALLGAAGVIGLSGLAGAQTVTPNPPGSEPAAAAPTHQRASPGHHRRPSATESLDAESGTVSAKGAPTSRRNKFVRDGSVAGVTSGLGGEIGSTSASGVSAATAGGGRSSASSGVTSAGGSSGAAASSSSIGASVSHSVSGITSAGGSQGGNAGGNAGAKSNGKGKGK